MIHGRKLAAAVTIETRQREFIDVRAVLQFGTFDVERSGQSENSVVILLSGYSFVSLRHETMASITDSIS
jgi:hypothetical protein